MWFEFVVESFSVFFRFSYCLSCGKKGGGWAGSGFLPSLFFQLFSIFNVVQNESLVVITWAAVPLFFGVVLLSSFLLSVLVPFTGHEPK